MKSAKMRKCFTKFSRKFECGAVAKQEKREDMLQFLFILAEQSACCPIWVHDVHASHHSHIFLTQCSPYSHCQSSVHGAPSFRYSSRPRCFAAAWWFRLRGRELRPEDACQKRYIYHCFQIGLIGVPRSKSVYAFSFFHFRFRFFSPQRRISVNLVDLVRCFLTSIYY